MAHPLVGWQPGPSEGESVQAGGVVRGGRQRLWVGKGEVPSTSLGCTARAAEVTLTANIAVNVTRRGVGGAPSDVDGTRPAPRSPTQPPLTFAGAARRLRLLDDDGHGAGGDAVRVVAGDRVRL